MHREFLQALADGSSLSTVKLLLEEAFRVEIEKDYADAKLIQLGLSADEGSVARIMAKAFVADTAKAVEEDGGEAVSK